MPSRPGPPIVTYRADSVDGGLGDRPGELVGRAPGLAGADGLGLPSGPGSVLPTLGAGIGAGTRMTGT